MSPPPLASPSISLKGTYESWLARIGLNFKSATQWVAAGTASHWRVLIALPAFGIAFAFTAYIILAHKLFWDFAVYKDGLAAFQAIGTPYDDGYLRQTFGLGLPFTYPPMIVLAFAQVSWLFTTPLGLALLLLMHMAAFVLIPSLLLPPDASRRETPWMVGLFLIAFGLSGTKLLLTGNAAALVSASVLLALRFSVPRRNYSLLWLILILVCQIKIYFICFAAVPFLLERKVLIPCLAVLAVLGVYSLNSLVSPPLLHGYLTTLASVSHIAGFVGTSVLSAVQIPLDRAGVGHAVWANALAWGIHCGFALLLLGFGIAVMWSPARPKSTHLAFLWAFMAALLISPRLAPYELALLVIPFLVFLRLLIVERGLGLGIALAGFVAAVSLVTTPLADWGGLVALIGVWVGIGVSWLHTPRDAHEHANDAAVPAGPSR